MYVRVLTDKGCVDDWLVGQEFVLVYGVLSVRQPLMVKIVVPFLKEMCGRIGFSCGHIAPETRKRNAIHWLK
jgi:hypothetical protein